MLFLHSGQPVLDSVFILSGGSISLSLFLHIFHCLSCGSASRACVKFCLTRFSLHPQDKALFTHMVLSNRRYSQIGAAQLKFCFIPPQLPVAWPPSLLSFGLLTVLCRYSRLNDVI